MNKIFSKIEKIKEAWKKIEEAWEREKEEGEEGKKRIEVISRIIIACLIISLIVLVSSIFMADTKTIITTIACLIIFWVALAHSIIFLVSDTCLGLPSSIFSGRIERNPDKDNFSVPIHKPYKEGLHIKLPWWIIKIISRKVYTKNLVKREYPTKNGTVIIKGMIQFRPSGLALYRFVEFHEGDISEAIDNETENIIRCKLAELDTEDAINKIQLISNELWSRLAGYTILPKEAETNGNKTGHIKARSRTLFGEPITYTEHSYGVEVFKIKIYAIDLTKDTKDERDSQQKELYKKERKKIQWKYLLERAKDLGKSFPELNDERILDAIQLWEKQSTKHTHKLELRDIEVLARIATELLRGRKK